MFFLQWNLPNGSSYNRISLKWLYIFSVDQNLAKWSFFLQLILNFKWVAPRTAVLLLTVPSL
eukprot:snap_masked-scaffold_5-processed-gene-18.38-mRNA-1 protein AED:1.00 eAED:1.00 QI:0/0/0/0/1/1/2/0/61